MELVSAFALPVPSIVICDLLGVPYEDHEFFEEQSRRLLRGPTAADTEDALARLEGYLGDLLDGKQAKAGEGVLDDLVARQKLEGLPAGKSWWNWRPSCSSPGTRPRRT